ncbi:MAG: hypothetical protein HY822_07575 [Acidobacteria bacterium]|nr:hypothetical protein [Acidobacteriota bacterium]
MGRWAVFVVVVAAAAGRAQNEVEPAVLTLARVKRRMAENLARLPNYTCLQTIERATRRTGSRKYQLLDTMRLEVGLVGGKELFAWPGAGRFEDRRLEDFAAPGGAIGNGSFALHARAVFLGSAPVFRFAGRETIDGRTLARYDFEVAQPFSGFQVRSGDATAIVGYHGSFWAGEETFDLVRFEIRAEDLPPVLRLASVSDVMHYARVPIGGGEFLLPVSSEMTMIDLRANESRNRIRFSNCQQYTGESVVRFGDPPDAAPAATPAPVSPRVFEMPADLPLEIELTSPIESGQSAIGDRVTAVLFRDARLKGRTVVPKGALLSGRLVHLERRHAFLGRGEVSVMVVGIEFKTVESSAGRADFSARLEEIGPVAVPGMRTDSSRPVITGQNGWGSPLRPGVGMFMLKGDTIKLGRGFRMIWRVIGGPGG